MGLDSRVEIQRWTKIGCGKRGRPFQNPVEEGTWAKPQGLGSLKYSRIWARQKKVAISLVGLCSRSIFVTEMFLCHPCPSAKTGRRSTRSATLGWAIRPALAERNEPRRQRLTWTRHDFSTGSWSQGGPLPGCSDFSNWLLPGRPQNSHVRFTSLGPHRTTAASTVH